MHRFASLREVWPDEGVEGRQPRVHEAVEGHHRALAVAAEEHLDAPPDDVEATTKL